MRAKGGKPYIWVTWITGLLAGTDTCYWRAWVKAHYHYDKVPGDPDNPFDAEGWQKRHDDMVQSRVTRLRDEGYTVTVEAENKFQLVGALAKLAGQPDIAAVDAAGGVLVVDEKSGKAKDMYLWQVLLYMFAMKITHFKNKVIRGEIEYSNSAVPIPASRLDTEAEQKIVDVIKIVAAPSAPPATPTADNCRYCDVLACEVRFGGPIKPSASVGDATKYF